MKTEVEGTVWEDRAVKRRDDQSNTGEQPEQDSTRGDPEIRELVRVIHRLPDRDPPPELLSRVMAAVATRPRPWWVRLGGWARAPRSLSFNYLQLGGAAAGALVAISIGLLAWFGVTHKGPSKDPTGLCAVVFHADLPEARSVHLIGSFNDWQPQGLDMTVNPGGGRSWTATLLLQPGRYEYAFLVDGHRLVVDPRARIFQEDGFGNRNAVLVVGYDDEKAI